MTKKTIPVTLRVPRSLLAFADEEAKAQIRGGYGPERTEVLRQAIARGLDAMKLDREKREARE